MNSKKKYRLLGILILCLLITTVIILYYFNTNKKGREFYIEKFYENQFLYEKISNSLMPISFEFIIVKESGEIVVRQNGETVEISKYSLDEETKRNIEKLLNHLDVKSINKTKDYLEYVYTSKKDKYIIAYATDESQFNSYTDVVHLEGNWYYCYIFNE